LCADQGWKGSDGEIGQNIKAKIGKEAGFGIRVKLKTLRQRDKE